MISIKNIFFTYEGKVKFEYSSREVEYHKNSSFIMNEVLAFAY